MQSQILVSVCALVCGKLNFLCFAEYQLLTSLHERQCTQGPYGQLADLNASEQSFILQYRAVYLLIFISLRHFVELFVAVEESLLTYSPLIALKISWSS